MEHSGSAPKRIRNFEIVRLIGRGAQRQIYEARCTASEGGVNEGELIALHCLRDSEQPYAEREIEILSKLDHPNILKFRHSFTESTENGDLYCIVTELLEGASLDARIESVAQRGLPWEEVKRIFSQILDALKYLASKEILHHDLKPSNIFVTRSGTAKLIDFGIARNHDQPGETQTVGAVLGTYDYMAPEFSWVTDKVFTGNEASEVFSFGVCLYQAVTGRLPFKRIEEGKLDHFSQWVTGPRPRADYRDLVFRIWSGLRTCIGRCLEFDPNLRPRTFRELATEFDGIRPFTVPPAGTKDVYEYVSLIGAGGFGEVFRAKHYRDGQFIGNVAVKRLLQANYSKRFEREAEILRKYQHPNLVRYVDFRKVDSESGPQFYLILEHLEGEAAATLKARLQPGPSRIEPMETLRLFISYLDALDFLHRNEIIHRDLKPLNLYAPVGNPLGGKVFDLGIALDQSGTQSHSQGSVPGSWDYMAPEFYSSNTDRGTPQSDLYALGVTLYQTLTGELPHPSARKIQEYYERTKNPKPIRYEHPVFVEFPRLDSLVGKALAHDPAHRFQSAEEMRQEIGKLIRFKQLSQAPTQNGDWTIALDRAELALEAKDWSGAAKLCEGVLKAEPANQRAKELFAVAGAMVAADEVGNSGRWIDALQILTERAAAFPANPWLRRARADLEMRVIESNRQASPGWRYDAAIEALQFKDFDRAFEHCDQILEKNPADTKAREVRSAAETLQHLNDAVLASEFSEVMQALDGVAKSSLRRLIKPELVAELAVEAGRKAIAEENLDMADSLARGAMRFVDAHEGALSLRRICDMVREARSHADARSWHLSATILRLAEKKLPGNSFLLKQARLSEIREAQIAIQAKDYDLAGKLCNPTNEAPSVEPIAVVLREIVSALVQANLEGSSQSWPKAIEVLRKVRRDNPRHRLVALGMTDVDSSLDEAIHVAETHRATQEQRIAELVRDAEAAILQDRKAGKAMLLQSAEAQSDVRWQILLSLCNQLAEVDARKASAQLELALELLDKVRSDYSKTALANHGLHRSSDFLDLEIEECSHTLARRRRKKLAWATVATATAVILISLVGSAVYRFVHERSVVKAWVNEVVGSRTLNPDDALRRILDSDQGLRPLQDSLRTWWMQQPLPSVGLHPPFAEFLTKVCQEEPPTPTWSGNNLPPPSLLHERQAKKHAMRQDLADIEEKWKQIEMDERQRLSTFDSNLRRKLSVLKDRMDKVSGESPFTRLKNACLSAWGSPLRTGSKGLSEIAAEHQKVIREYPEKSTSPKNEVPAKEGASVPQSGQTPDPPNKESKQPQALNTGATQERVGPSGASPVLAVNKGWTNALGQRFVPVKGLTVLFATTETSIKDYQFVMNRSLNSLDNSLTTDHPAVFVSWRDATNYAGRITLLDRKQNGLSPGDRFRLPSVEEWVQAASTIQWEGDASTGWWRSGAKPSFSVNIAGKEIKSNSKISNQKFQADFDDDYVWTAPVLGKPQTLDGLCHLVGNVSEWCETKEDSGRVSRRASSVRIACGAAWDTADEEQLAPGYRWEIPGGKESVNVGIRLVLELAN